MMMNDECLAADRARPDNYRGYSGGTSLERLGEGGMHE